MFQGRVPAILLSIILHVLLVTGIVISVNKPAVKTTQPPKTINSFLYTKPKAKPSNVTVEVPQKQSTASENKDITKAIIKEEKLTKPILQTTPSSENVESLPSEQNNLSILTQKGEQADSVSISTKAFNQLEQLKKNIKKQIVDDAVYEKFRRRSPSVLDGDPYPVPHSVQSLTAEQKKAQNTARYSDDISLIKGEDGNCILEQDLSAVGIEGIKAYSYFECGQSAFDRNFKSHMDKVLKKIGK